MVRIHIENFYHFHHTLAIIFCLLSTVSCCGSFSTNPTPEIRTSPSAGGFDSSAVSTFDGAQATGSNKQLGNALGGNIEILTDLATATGGMIRKTTQLVCTNWGDSCRWRNDRVTDKLQWQTGVGEPDTFRLQASTGTRDLPSAPFGVVQSSRVLNALDSANLLSDPIPCQAGDAEIRLKYWSSPFVQMLVCQRLLGAREFSYCSPPITNGDPGPAFVNVPGPINRPFQIVIVGRNFVYSNSGFDGGFLIIDDVSYIGSLCNAVGQLFNGPPRANNAVDFNRALPELDSPALKIEKNPNVGACQVLTCDFSEGQCLEYMKRSQWRVNRGPIGNPLTGIRGDGSQLPFNPRGSFAYAEGSDRRVRLETPRFHLNKTANLMFAYYKASADTTFEILAARPGERELSIFRSPLVNRDSRRWFRELRQLLPGDYEKLIFQADRLRENTFVGLDEIKLVDRDGTSLC